MTARLVLICHASTDAVRKSIFPDDEPLDAHGLKDAAALAGHLPHVDRCWTSPELRTRQTAEAMQLNADVQPMLRECDYGHWRGRSFDEVNAQQPEAVAAWLLDPSAAPHGGESDYRSDDAGRDVARRSTARRPTVDHRHPRNDYSRGDCARA